MTLTVERPDAAGTSPPPKSPRRLAAFVVAVAVVTGALGAGLALAVGGPSSAPATSSSGSGGLFAYYQSMMGRYGFGAESMMGGGSSYGWMMGQSGYGWMMGGATTPGWMHGGALPRFMMGTSTDPGKVMGRLFADAPGPRVSPAQAAGLGNQTPAGATVDRSANRIVFSGSAVRLTVVASPTGNPDETFRAAGLVNPTIVVPRGAEVTIQLVNADPDTAHGLVVATPGAASSWMPMMTTAPAFPGSALWFLGNPTGTGMHSGTFTFTASTAGAYEYLCPVPGHAQKGMVGTFLVNS
jgi:rusticyanin